MKQQIQNIIFLFSLFFGMVNAQNIQITSSLDTNMILIGEQTQMSVDFKYPNGADVQFPILKDTIVDKIEILDLSLDTIPDANFEHYILKYTLTSFDTGYYAIPPQIIVDNETGDTIWGNPLGFAVNTYEIDSASAGKFFDIKQPYQAPWTFQEFLDEYLSIILIVLLLITLIIAVIWYLKKHKKVEKVEPKKVIPKEAAHIIAIRELNQLKEKKLWQADRVKEYYVELSDIVRDYLENRFKIAALEQTSQEILESIERGKQLDKEQLAELKQILSLSDMAKFAKAKPLANENDLALKNAFDLVEQTKLEKAEAEEVEDSQTENPPEQINLTDSKSNQKEKEADNE